VQGDHRKPARGWDSVPEAKKGVVKAVMLRSIQEVDVSADELIARAGKIPDRPDVLLHPLGVLEAEAPLWSPGEEKMLQEPGGIEILLQTRMLERERAVVLRRVARRDSQMGDEPVCRAQISSPGREHLRPFQDSG
jgi:hypothetical protein